MVPRYPQVAVQLTGEDGNAFAILGRCRAQMKAVGIPQREIDAFFSEATAGDYNDLLATCVEWFEVF